MNPTALFWFRRDLRLHDQHGLYKALKNHKSVLLIFIFDPEILDHLPEDDARVDFIYNQLKKIWDDIDNKKSFIPVEINKIFLNSMGFILDNDKAAMWRGPMLSGAIKQLKDLTQWGDLDYLFIDMPPGTGDAYLTVAAEIKPNYVVLVTSQSRLAVQDTIKSKVMFDKLKIPIVGVIDNMSYSIDSHSDKQISDYPPLNIASEVGLNVLGSIPRSKDLADFNPNQLSHFFGPIYKELLNTTS